MRTDGHETRPWILKLHTPLRAAPEASRELSQRTARREYEMLSHLWQAFAPESTRCTVPRPLEFFPECAAILTEKCQGQRLDRMLRWNRFLKTNQERSQLADRLEACGEWLGLFHQITKRDADPATVYERITRDFHEELTCIRAQGLDPALTDRIAKRFDAEQSIARTGKHEVVGYHCDFGPYNVFVSAERVTVIDLEGFQDGILYDDLCYFLGMLESTSFYHLSRADRCQFRRSFLKGYSRYQTLDEQQLEFFLLISMVKIMAHAPLMRECAPRGLRRWHRRLQMGLYARWFEKHLEARDKLA